MGQSLASGYLDCDELNDMKFHDEPIIKSTKEPNFLLLDVSEELKTVGRIKVILSEVEKQKKEEELEALFKEKPYQAQRALSEWKELHMSGFERTDEDLGKLLCKSDSFWHENNLLYKAYAEPEKLETDGVRLLFFQTSKFNRLLSPEEIWSPITSRKDYGITPNIPF